MLELNKIYHGDCLEVMKQIDDNSIDAIVTDPPYELGFMGKAWDASGIAYNVAVWKETLRVLKPGGHLLAFGGTRTYHRMACAIEDAGFEIRDMIEWVYGSGFPKSHNIGLRLDQKLGLQGFRGKETSFSAKTIQGKYVDGRDKVLENGKAVEKYEGKSEIAKQYQGWGTALKPAHEPICMARKPLSEKTVAENCLKWGTGGINIDESRIFNNDLTGNDLYNKLVLNLTKEDLCQSKVSHLFVVNAEKKKFPEDMTRGIETLFSAVGNVDMPTSEKIIGIVLEGISKLDTGCSESMLMENINTSLNTFISGKDRTEQNQKDMNFITLTETSLITGLKTSNSLNQANTEALIKENTLQENKTLKHEQGNSKSAVPAGRFPSNLIHDNSEEVRACFPETKSVKANNVQRKDCPNTAMSGRNYARFNEEEGYNDSGNASRFFKSIIYTAKASKAERNTGCEGMPLQHYLKDNKMGGERDTMLTGSGNPRDCRKHNNHPTVKPVALMEYLINMVTPKGGMVLDPFMGSGTTGVAAANLGVGFIGIELDEEYCKIAEARIDKALRQKETVLELDFSEPYNQNKEKQFNEQSII